MNAAKPWLAQYPKGVPENIDLSQYQSIVDVIDQSVAQFRHRPAFANMGRTLSYDDSERLSRHFASFLRFQLKLDQGDRVALMLPNILPYPIVLFAVLRAGLTVVNTNPLYTGRELKHQLVDSGAKAIVVLESVAHTLSEVIADTAVEHVIVVRLGDLLHWPKSTLVNWVVRYIKKKVPAYSLPRAVPFLRGLKQGATLPPVEVKLTHEDLAFLQYTGGTTGVAKGAMLSHGNIVANIQQASAWLGTGLEVGQETVITALPLYHIFALTANCFVFIKLGGLNQLITNPRDMRGFVKELGQVPFSVITGVNTLFNALLHTPGFERLDFSRLRLTLGGGMAVQRDVAQRWKKTTACTLVEAYGLTETSPAACINPLDLDEYNGYIGLPISSTIAEIKDDQGKALPLGEVGELCIKGPQVTLGYWQKPAETAEAITADGFFRSGDMAYMTEQGFVKIVDRKKDMILVSGFNVYPNEIEDVVASHDKVLEAAAIGIPDEYSGEAVKLCVVKKDPSLTEEELIAFCKEQLTGYKVPKVVAFFDELPKTNVGKILRRDLRDD